MQRAIIVNCSDTGRKTEDLNDLLFDGWKVIRTEPFRPSDGANLGNYTPGNVLVIVEKE